MFKKYRSHYITILPLAIPVVISQLGHTLVHVADSIIVGRFAGTIPLAAVSLVNSIFTIILVIGLGLSYGLTPLISQANGRNDEEECGVLLSNSLLINAVASIILFVFTYFGSLLIIDHLGQDAEVIRVAKPYLKLLSISIIPLMIFMTFKQFTEGLGFTKQAMQITIWGNILNICLGVIFVKGLFGIAPMGVSGVGWSTLIDRTLMAIVMAFYVIKNERFKMYIRQFSIKNYQSLYCIKLLKIGVPIALQYTFEISAFSAAAIIMGVIGTNEQAAHQVAISLAAMTYMMASGISAAAAIKSGNNFGQKTFGDLRLSAISSYHLVIGFMSFTAIILFVFHKQLPYIYTSDQNVIVIASQLLIFAAVFQLFDGVQVVGLGILRGMGDVKIPTVITLIAYWIIGIPIAYFFGIVLNYGAGGIWLGLTIGLLVAATLLYFRFNFLSKKLDVQLV